jgi:hypothetical protein
MPQKPSFPATLALTRIKIKEAEKEIEYLTRCYVHLDEKRRTAPEEKQFRKCCLRLLQLNRDVLPDLWTWEKLKASSEALIAEQEAKRSKPSGG